jgi:hypothetical protein
MAGLGPVFRRGLEFPVVVASTRRPWKSFWRLRRRTLLPYAISCGVASVIFFLVALEEAGADEQLEFVPVW